MTDTAVYPIPDHFSEAHVTPERYDRPVVSLWRHVRLAEVVGYGIDSSVGHCLFSGRSG